MRIVGIDIGSYSIKVAEISATPKSFEIRNILTYALNSDPVADNQIAILDILRNLTTVYDPASVAYVFTIDQEKIVTRFKTFPFRERNKILKSVAYELEDDIPFSREDAIFESKTVRFRGQQAEVIALACPREHIARLLGFVHDAGIDPDIISCQGVCLGNLFENWTAAPPDTGAIAISDDPDFVAPPEAPSEATLLLDLGHSKTIVGVFRDSTLLYTRTIDWGGSHLAHFVAQKYSVTYLEALKEVQTKSFILVQREGATADQVRFSEIIEESLNGLVNELKLSLLHIKTQFNVHCTKIYLTGGVSRIVHLTAHLTQRLEISVNLLAHHEAYARLNLDPTADHASVSALAMATAMEGLRRPRNPACNFRKEQFSKQSQTLTVLWDRWAYTAKLAGCALFLIFIYAYLKSSEADHLVDVVNESLKSQAKSIANLSGSQATPARMRQFIQNRQKDMSTQKTLEKLSGLPHALDYIAQLTKTLPAKNIRLDIRELTIQTESITLAGEVDSKSQVDAIKQSLISMAADGKVIQSEPTFRPLQGRAAFSFQIKLSRLARGAKI